MQYLSEIFQYSSEIGQSNCSQLIYLSNDKIGWRVWLLVKNLYVIFQTWYNSQLQRLYVTGLTGEICPPHTRPRHSQCTAGSEGNCSQGLRLQWLDILFAVFTFLAWVLSFLSLYLRPLAKFLFSCLCQGFLKEGMRVLFPILTQYPVLFHT